MSSLARSRMKVKKKKVLSLGALGEGEGESAGDTASSGAPHDSSVGT
jgi:hypothetical protein